MVFYNISYTFVATLVLNFPLSSSTKKPPNSSTVVLKQSLKGNFGMDCDTVVMVRFSLGLSFTPLGAFQCHGRCPWGVGPGLGGGGGAVGKW